MARAQNSEVCKKHSYYQKEKEKLIELPLNNLIMMEHQLNNLSKTDKSRNKEKQRGHASTNEKPFEGNN
jgi:hypothetical protein